MKLLCPFGHQWDVTPTSFKLGTNCRKCAGRCSEKAKIEFLVLCENRGYKAIGQYINNRTKVKLICPYGHKWNVIPRNFKTGANCRKCNGNCPEEAEEKWKNFIMHYKYTPLTEYVNSKTKVLIRCNWCDKEFWTIPGKRYNNLRGCPRCNNSDSETTREAYYQKLILTNITPIELYINAHTRVLVKYNSCGTEWYIDPGKFLYEDRNKCPHCRKREKGRKKNNSTCP
ncbi:hypothetical protein ACQCVL_17165 [Bacillus thuringiensis]|uniref:hypothetical protein n=1 Tax=Bacillus thuringiensis TaxID=1428 RepID=UPI003CEA84F5